MLNPIIRGWSNYHRTVVAKRIFSEMDKELFRLLEWFFGIDGVRAGLSNSTDNQCFPRCGYLSV
jgi:hypothetical protein